MLKMCEESARLFVEGVARKVGGEEFRLFNDWLVATGGAELSEILRVEWEDGAGVGETARAIQEHLKRVVN